MGGVPWGSVFSYPHSTNPQLCILGGFLPNPFFSRCTSLGGFTPVSGLQPLLNSLKPEWGTMCVGAGVLVSRWDCALQQRHWVGDGAAGKVMEGRAAWPSSQVRMVLPALFLGQPAAGLACTVCLPSCRKQGITCFCVLSLTSHSFVPGLHLLFSSGHPFIASSVHAQPFL